ncbi:preprotein translocase subunit SecD [Halorientalis brevis]|uniref:Protein-export membrane protein SecD n=1 Tax=Halorientalis brevis TaxID=1126241 RepID=A0ABD6C955_9EURY|nr:preprotein translocase subunit SecD [Halorientalis brevis]
MNLRENWRVVLLVVFVVASGVALLAPAVSGGDGATGLQYGLELSGGTSIRAPLVGMTAENVNISQTVENENQKRAALANALNVSESDVTFRARERAVEVYSDNVTEQAFVTALNDNGFDVADDDVRSGVTQQTREDAVAILDEKVNQAGLTGGGARLTTSGTGQHFVVVEVPNANRTEVLNLIADRGQVEMVAHFPADNGSHRQVTLLTNEDFVNIGSAQPPNQAQPNPYVSVALTDEAARNYSNAMQRFGFTSQDGIANCPTRTALQDPQNASGYCLYTVQDGRAVYAAQMSRGLAGSMESGDFVKDPSFVITATNMTEAQQLSVNLKAGALPTELAIDDGTTYYLQPSLAQEFKVFSVIAGLVAWLAVSFVVFLRYGSPRVAVPMLGTAAAEVFLLLGFASTVGLALDLSHIAGFIAVIGTGVDDLIIIADEILQEGDVATGRVFQNRFKKAFWVIGAAAATTIIAMSPLTVLSLGDLTGFAIVTIVGVLIGVLVTRPAYGDILRNLMLDEYEE